MKRSPFAVASLLLRLGLLRARLPDGLAARVPADLRRVDARPPPRCWRSSWAAWASAARFSGGARTRIRVRCAFYGNLELLIALSAALSPLLLWLVAKIYIAHRRLGRRSGLTLATIVRLMLSALVLAVPTLLMGGTLPAAARAVETSDDAGRRSWRCSTALNTLGAVTGALLSTFFLLETFGNRKTLLDRRAAQPAVVAMAARALASRRVRSAGVRGRRRRDDARRLYPPRIRPHGRGDRRLRLPADGAGLVPDARSAPRRLDLHLRPDPGRRAARHRPRRRGLSRSGGGGAARPPAASRSPARSRRR